MIVIAIENIENKYFKYCICPKNLNNQGKFTY